MRPSRCPASWSRVCAPSTRDSFRRCSTHRSSTTSILVNNRDAVIGVRRLLDEEGIFAGLSSGAALAVAVRVARDMPGGNVVVLLADGGWKYLSTDLWTRDLDELEDELEGALLW